jgi:hypoxanthine phosphoribosyltransferase
MLKDVEKILLPREVIHQRVKDLGQQISEDYRELDLLIVGVLRGAVVFMADLVRVLSIPAQFDFMAVSSYGSATKTSGVVRILKDLDEDILGRHVLLVEDIVDTGLTLNYLVRNLKSRQPASLEICALLSKEGKQQIPLKVRYLGFTIPDQFVVGYGLDYGEKYRNLPDVCVLRPEICAE